MPKESGDVAAQALPWPTGPDLAESQKGKAKTKQFAPMDESSRRDGVAQGEDLFGRHLMAGDLTDQLREEVLNLPTVLGGQDDFVSFGFVAERANDVNGLGCDPPLVHP